MSYNSIQSTLFNGSYKTDGFGNVTEIFLREITVTKFSKILQTNSILFEICNRNDNYQLNVSGLLNTLEGLPTNCNVLSIGNCPELRSLKGIENFKILTKLIIPNTTLLFLLSPFKIKTLKELVIFGPENKKPDHLKIIEKHINSGSNILKCQKELIENGFKDGAKS